MLDGQQTSTPDQPAIGYFLRLYWMAFGNFALFFAWLKLCTSERVGSADIVYGGLALALLASRWVDITMLNGMTIRALPATRADLRKYSIALVGLTLIGWVTARWLSGLS